MTRSIEQRGQRRIVLGQQQQGRPPAHRHLAAGPTGAVNQLAHCAAITRSGEAAGAFKQHLFDRFGARTLTADFPADNPASGRVLQKLGFVATSRGDHFCLGRGEMVPGVSMIWTAQET